MDLEQHGSRIVFQKTKWCGEGTHANSCSWPATTYSQLTDVNALR